MHSELPYLAIHLSHEHQQLINNVTREMVPRQWEVYNT